MEDDAREPIRCAACDMPMTHVRTIWRAFQPTLEVWECRTCDKTVRRPSTGHGA